MSNQVRNMIYYENEFYIMEMFNPMYLKPENFGFESYSEWTCGESFEQIFEVKDETLFLKELYVNDARIKQNGIKNYTPPKINKKLPTINENKSEMYDLIYVNLSMKVNYTGKILLPKNIIEDIIIHRTEIKMNWMFENIIGLEFSNGKLIRTSDESEYNRLLRENHILERLYKDSLRGYTNEKYKKYYDRFIKSAFDIF